MNASFDFAGALDNPNTTMSSLNVTTSVLNATIAPPWDTTANSSGMPGGVVFCPEIGMKAGWYDNNIRVSSHNRGVGDIVRISCNGASSLRGPSVLKCHDHGVWNGTQPHCADPTQVHVGLHMSTVLLISVVFGCAVLVILVVTVLLCKFVCCSRSNKSDVSSRGTEDTSDRESTSPYYAVHILNRTKPPDSGSVHYAKPEIYSSFVNPGFYEDAYAKWRSREELSERVYDSPFLMNRRLEQQCQGPDMKWSTQSLQAHEHYDYGKFGKIPRSHVTEEQIEESEDLTTF